MRSHRNSVISSSTNAMFRKFRRLRVTVIFYVCCCVAILFFFVSFNDNLRRFLQHKQLPSSSSFSQLPASPHEYGSNKLRFRPGQQPDLIESALVSSRDVQFNEMGDFGVGADEAGRGLKGIMHDPSLLRRSFIPHDGDIDDHLSKVRRELNTGSSYSFSQSSWSSRNPNDNEKPWFMLHGTKYPSLRTGLVGKNLWYEECENEDRILNQLMYMTEDSINQLPNATASSSIASNLYEYSVGLIGSVASAVVGGTGGANVASGIGGSGSSTSDRNHYKSNKIPSNFLQDYNDNTQENTYNTNTQSVNTNANEQNSLMSAHTNTLLTYSERTVKSDTANTDTDLTHGLNVNSSSSSSRTDITVGGVSVDDPKTINGLITGSSTNSNMMSMSRNPKKSRLKNILLYYGLGMSWGSQVVGGRQIFLQQKCPVNACRLTGSRSQLSKADVVVFKDVFMNPKVNRPPNQLWTMYMLECPLNTQNFLDKNVFNLTATYRHDSDIVTPYEKWVYYNDEVRALPQDINYAAGKTKKVAWFVSNCVAKNNRLEYARELGKYIDVDIYGACGSHSCSRANSKQCFELLSKNYKFYLAFENSNCRDYISEKFFVNGLGNNIIPIVMGAHPDDYKRVAPIKSYIHVDDFASPKELAEFLHTLDQDDEAYNDYFKWKGTGEFINTHFFCRLCAMAHYADRSDHKPRYYNDFNKWWRGPHVCIRRSWRGQPDIFASDYSDKQTTYHQPKTDASFL